MQNHRVTLKIIAAASLYCVTLIGVTTSFV
jgi:hypothetical protein